MQYIFFFKRVVIIKKKIKKYVSFSFNTNFADLFIGTKVKNTIFFGLRNIYQH